MAIATQQPIDDRALEQELRRALRRDKQMTQQGSLTGLTTQAEQPEEMEMRNSTIHESQEVAARRALHRQQRDLSLAQATTAQYRGAITQPQAPSEEKQEGIRTRMAKEFQEEVSTPMRRYATRAKEALSKEQQQQARTEFRAAAKKTIESTVTKVGSRLASRGALIGVVGSLTVTIIIAPFILFGLIIWAFFSLFGDTLGIPETFRANKIEIALIFALVGGVVFLLAGMIQAVIATVQLIF